jgi:hypothetical protein
MIYLLTEMGCHPVAAVQYIFTHKQYTERYKTNNTQNNTTILEECGPCPILASYTLHLPYNRGKSTEKPQSE